MGNKEKKPLSEGMRAHLLDGPAVPRREMPTHNALLSPSQKHHECATSAAFLGSLRTQKQGDCPPTARASGFAAACAPANLYQGGPPTARPPTGHLPEQRQLFSFLELLPPSGVPLRPRRDITFLEDQHGWLTVSWVSRFNVSAEPVLYILQRRWDQGIRPSEDPASDWQTRSAERGIPRRRPGERRAAKPQECDCVPPTRAHPSPRQRGGPSHIRVPQKGAVLSRLGQRRDVSEMKRIVKLQQFATCGQQLDDNSEDSLSSSGADSGTCAPLAVQSAFAQCSSSANQCADPSPPAKPQNLRRAELRERPDGSVSVLVLWDPPKEDEVAVHHYRVSWRACKGRRTGRGRTERVRVTEGAVCEMELRDLRPDTAYVVQVQAVAYGGQKRMRSSRSQLTFATPSQ
ncbi:hypothetical protein Z043_106874, partial [Scleropages formosus]